jgi:hypothetical protein
MFQSIRLDWCWVCERRFVDATPAGHVSRNEHHIIPRAAGGADGPTVSLCSDHHDALHKIALRLTSGKPYFDLLAGENEEQRKKLYWLATRVYNAFQAVKNDPNKKAAVMIMLDRRQQFMITQLSKVYPQAKSREDILNIALETLYTRHFSK